MPVLLNGLSYYRTAEVCRMAGISRNTLFRWMKAGVIVEPPRRDWRGWRLFSQDQVALLKARTNFLIEIGRDAIPADSTTADLAKVDYRYHSANKLERGRKCLTSK